MSFSNLFQPLNRHLIALERIWSLFEFSHWKKIFPHFSLSLQSGIVKNWSIPESLSILLSITFCITINMDSERNILLGMLCCNLSITFSQHYDKKFALAIFLDFTNAFDTAGHEILISKL